MFPDKVAEDWLQLFHDVDWWNHTMNTYKACPILVNARELLEVEASFFLQVIESIRNTISYFEWRRLIRVFLRSRSYLLTSRRWRLLSASNISSLQRHIHRLRLICESRRFVPFRHVISYRSTHLRRLCQWWTVLITFYPFFTWILYDPLSLL